MTLTAASPCRPKPALGGTTSRTRLPTRSPALAVAVRFFARKFQQLTSPVMAKGVEDTAFYIYNRLASLNDVGGDPSEFGMPRKRFHRASGRAPR